MPTATPPAPVNRPARIRARLALFLALSALAAEPRATHAQAPPSDLEGDWLVSLARSGAEAARKAGAAALVLGEPQAGTVSVEGAGMSVDLGAFFVVAPGQALQRDSKGRLAGALALEDGAGGGLGELVVEEGRANADATSFSLAARLAPAGGEPVALRLRGTRPPFAEPVLTGRSTRASVEGAGVRSRFYEVAVAADPAGFPFFTVEGAGPVLVDGQELPDVPLTGRLVLDARGRLFGAVASPVLGDGLVTGTLKPGKTSPVPKLVAKAQTGARRFRVSSLLDKAVAPILSVRPATAVAFGPVELTAAAERVFTVRNAGIGVLEGAASVASGDADFVLVGAGGAVVEEIPYALAEDEQASVRLRFQPAEPGPRAAVLAFTGGGGAARNLSGVGQSLRVTPSAGLDFGNVAVGASEDAVLTLTNVGDEPLAGEASVSDGGADFALLQGGSEVASIAYQLAPGASRDVAVRFAPASAGAKAGAVTATGGGADVVRALAGNATPAP